MAHYEAAIRMDANEEPPEHSIPEHQNPCRKWQCVQLAFGRTIIPSRSGSGTLTSRSQAGLALLRLNDSQDYFISERSRN